MEESHAYFNPELKGKCMEEWIHFFFKKKTKIKIKIEYQLKRFKLMRTVLKRSWRLTATIIRISNFH